MEQVERIVDEAQVREFIRRLPELSITPPSVHLLMMAVRSRLAKQVTGVKLKDLVIEKSIMRPAADWRSKYFNTVYNFAVLKQYGKYDARDIRIAPEVFAIFATLAPRRVTGAVAELIRENVVYAFQNNAAGMYELSKQTSRFFGLLHQHPIGGLHFVSVDVDDPSQFTRARDLTSVLPKFMITKTSRGNHIVLNLSRAEDAQAFYDQRDKRGVMFGLKGLQGVEVKKDMSEPVPGTRYAAAGNPDNIVTILE
ncbi:MAG: hypothetical protein JRN62_03625 [Nitrososphaerota archaeon]|jgi:hypothetical protein|nr:hypothetical protein [Nitrososphaerota archaeon]MDG6948691.1 hypothetical protein [Nitrososphaerota archaeon]